MGKTKQKNHKQEEFYLHQIRHLKKELKRKDQKIKQLEKDLGYSQNKAEKLSKSRQTPDYNTCPDCGKGIIKEMDLGVKIYEVCSLCDYRKKK